MLWYRPDERNSETEMVSNVLTPHMKKESVSKELAGCKKGKKAPHSEVDGRNDHGHEIPPESHRTDEDNKLYDTGLAKTVYKLEKTIRDPSRNSPSYSEENPRLPGTDDSHHTNTNKNKVHDASILPNDTTPNKEMDHASLLEPH